MNIDDRPTDQPTNEPTDLTRLGKFQMAISVQRVTRLTSCVYGHYTLSSLLTLLGDWRHFAREGIASRPTV